MAKKDKEEQFSFEKLADAQAKRIYEKLEKTEPGSKEYRELQSQLGAFEIMKEKRNAGKISKSQWAKICVEFVFSTLIMLGAVTSDIWMPHAFEKLKLGEFATKTIKSIFK